MKYTSTLGITASGSMDGITAAHNRYGQYFRRRAIPVNPGSSAQVIVRNFFATLAAQWSSFLGQPARDSWIAYAAAMGNRTGLNWFIGVNTIRLQCSLPVIQVNVSTTFTMATMTPPVPTASTTSTSHAFTSAGGPTGVDGWANVVGGALAVYQSAPQSVTRTFFRGPYRFAGRILGAAVPPVSPTVFPNPYAGIVGQKFFYKYVSMTPEGKISSPIYREDII